MSAQPIDPKDRPLTPKQHAFCENVLAGMRPAQAYREGYKSGMSARCCTQEAQRLLRLAHVQHYLEVERAKMQEASLLTRIEKRAALGAIVRSKAAKNGDRIRAIEVDNLMTGDNAPTKHEVFGLAELMKLVRSGK